MHKKLITTSLALVALAAFALPALAQATNKPTVTHPTGTVLATGSKIDATNIGDTLMVDTVNETQVQLRCSSATMTGTLTSNTTGNVQGEISSATFTGSGSGGACTGFFGSNATVHPLGLPWCLKSLNTYETDEFRVFGGPCTGAAKKIEFQLTVAGGTCTYQSTSTTAARGTYTTHAAGDAVMTIPRAGHPANEDAGFTKIHDSTFLKICPHSSGLKMSFTLETDTTAASDPLYISE